VQGARPLAHPTGTRYLTGVPLNWPGAAMTRVDVSAEIDTEIRDQLDQLGDQVRGFLFSGYRLPAHASPLFQPWGLFVAVQSTNVLVTFLSQSGMPDIFVIDSRSRPPMSIEAFSRQVAAERNAPIAVAFALDPIGTDSTTKAATRTRIAIELAKEADQKQVLGRLGDLSGYMHLEAQLRTFLADHPDPDKNVFIMMRFVDTKQFTDLHSAITTALSAHGLHGVRADDREYHPDLWSNVETYMLGCSHGIAVFEDFEVRGHNPNVALELGFMRARHKRCLILKERTLPSVPTDVVGALYKAFDKFNIGPTVKAQVDRWITVDLRLA
jgi:hypothetical protein